MYTTNYLNEIWKPVRGYVGLYEVSNYGRVRSVDRIDPRGHKRTGDMRKTHTGPHGYVRVHLSKNGAIKIHQVHRLVWEAFNGPIPEGMQVNHIDENPSNNRLENLNLMTPSQNINYGTRNKKVSGKLKCSKRCVPVQQVSLDGIVINEFISLGDAARSTGIDRGLIQKCCAKVGWHKSASGFVWRYA